MSGHHKDQVKNRRQTDRGAHSGPEKSRARTVVIPKQLIQDQTAVNVDYETRYRKKDRSFKIIKEMSEFLRILTLRESDILKTMIVRFAIESIEASQGSLLVYDAENNYLKYQDTYLYENNRIILESYGELLKDAFIRPGEGIVGDAYIKSVPIMVENLAESDYQKPLISELMNIQIGSVIAMPLKVNNEVEAVLEIANQADRPMFTQDDLEAITVIANFASTQLDNARLFLWAIHDSLTGLYNNQYFYKELAEEIEKSKRYGRVFSLVMFDIDNFKHINDNYGHSSGDRALQVLSDCIRKTIRKEVDIAARYGGDEFVIVLSNTRAEDALRVSERLLNLVRSHRIPTSDAREFHFTLSMGITEFPRDGEESYYLFNRADEALYTSKRNGKNTITIYENR